MSIDNKTILKVLENVIEPDLKKDIVQLGLVKEITVDGKSIKLSVEMSNPAMHSKKRMIDAIEFQVKKALGMDLEVETTIKGIEKKNDPQLRKILPGVKILLL